MTTNLALTSDVYIRPIRYPLFLFIIVAALSFTVTENMFSLWERRLGYGIRAFNGTIADAGTGIPGHPDKGRWQTIRMSNGVPVIIWMDEAGRLGDRVKGIATFERGESMRNPGGFSTRLWLRSNGVAHAGYLIRCEIERVDHVVWSIRRLPDNLRDRVRFHVSSFWASTKGGALLASLTLGNTSQLSDLELHHLRVSGLAHLTSVSGTHLYFFLAPFRAMTRKAARSRRGTRRALFAFTLLPGVLCGWKSGIARASLTIFALRLDAIFGRRRDPMNSLLFVATCLLLINPFAIRSQSYWMSLVAAGAIRFISDYSDERRKRDEREVVGESEHAIKAGKWSVWTERFFRGALYKMKGVLLISVTVQIAVMPYILMTSAGFQMLSPFVNAIAMPIASFLTATGYIMIITLVAIPLSGCQLMRIGAIFASVLEPGTELLHRLARQGASLRGTFVTIRSLVLIVLIAVFGYLLFNESVRSMQRRRLAIVVVTLAIAASAVWSLVQKREWRVVFLDVDQGDATLIVTPEGYTCLIDGGDRGHGFNTILPVIRLYSLGVIDLAIVTHAHGDHAAGIAELIECGVVDRLCLPVTSHRPSRKRSENDWEGDLTDRLLKSARETGISCITLKAGDRLIMGSLSIDVHYPEEDRDNHDLNDDSLILQMDLDGCKILFTGDITEKGERRLLRQSTDLSVDVLHVPHHGSRSSSSRAFLESVAPRISIISVGRDNRFSHPHARVLERLSDIGSDVFRTDRSGAIILNIREGKGTITEWIAP